jgi:hypothetical protein
MRLNHDPNFNFLFVSRRPGYVQQVSLIFFSICIFFCDMETVLCFYLVMCSRYVTHTRPLLPLY